MKLYVWNETGRTQYFMNPPEEEGWREATAEEEQIQRDIEARYEDAFEVIE